MSVSTDADAAGAIQSGIRTHSTWPSEDGKLLAVAHEESIRRSISGYQQFASPRSE